jgi:DNA polymerase I
MAPLRFWILDVAGEVEEGGPMVWLWGVSGDGERVIVRSSFKPSFYIAPSEEPDSLASRIADLRLEGVESVSVVEKRLRGQPIKVVEVKCGVEDTKEVAERLRKRLPECGEIYGDDVRYSQKFLCLNKLAPCSWVSVEAIRSGHIGSYPMYTPVGRFEPAELVAPPDLRVLAFDAQYLSERGSPQPERDPVAIISIVSSDGSEGQFVGGESEVLRGFIRVVNSFDPDIVAGFGSNKRHMPYLSARARRVLGGPLSIGRLGAEPHTSVYGHVSLQGRVNLDFQDMAEQTVELKLESLEAFTLFLGIKMDFDTVEEFDVAETWKRDRDRVLRYSLQRARAVMEMYRVLSDYVFSLSAITFMPADHVLTASTGFRVESRLMAFASGLGELIPRRREVSRETYPGAVVIEPKPGLHREVAVLDFRSMYPSLMLKHNISFDTVVTQDGDRPPGLDFGFRRAPQGFIPLALRELLDERLRVRAIIQRGSAGPVEMRVYEARERALKVTANATYGYLGWPAARWYSREAAEATTAWGRAVITSAIQKAGELGLTVIYGDTDSIFVNHDEAKISRLVEWVSQELGLEVRLEKVYQRAIFTEAKKRYAGLTTDGRLELVGLEAVRGDWSEIAKEAQAAVIESVLRSGSWSAGLLKAREYIKKIREGHVPLKKLVIWKQITRPLEDYEATQPHIVVAKQLLEEGWRITPGDKVGFVITRGPGRLYEKARPYFKASQDLIDWEYYLEKQVLPSCLRVLEPFGVTEKDLRKSPEGVTLTDFA